MSKGEKGKKSFVVKLEDNQSVLGRPWEPRAEVLSMIPSSFGAARSNSSGSGTDKDSAAVTATAS